MELDKIIELLLQAKTEVHKDPAKSRELALVLTKIDEALLWRYEDIKIKDSKPKGDV